eukprot:CAMPEP_0183732988 /NCGR_PEP_ID=MMETSP0737-20130205/39887_1 /TAXON_ID=385413 /ORGANISM="Thalassiosira miniscula, Strain CCMP1093" /LENGTH=358 /DNA_ID=CAMNT_0025966149 /DNA_START=121 /DNA_END=1194 /DNA_ORIENTATION=-
MVGIPRKLGPKFPGRRRRYIVGLSILAVLVSRNLFDVAPIGSPPVRYEQTVRYEQIGRVLNIPNRTIMMVHVGKSGGSTFRRAFSRQYYRPGNLLQRFNIFPVCHMWACQKPKLDSVTSLLWVVRNPVDRIISTYKYGHPENCVRYVNHNGKNATNGIFGCRVKGSGLQFYKNCASTLEYFASLAFTNSSQHDEHRCRISAEKFFGGRDQISSNHAYYNFKYYKTTTIDKYNPVTKWKLEWNNETNYNTTIIRDKEILVVRNEHMWEDAANLDILLGGNGDFNTDQKVTHGSEKYHNHTSQISVLGYKRLCCMLHEEIDVFEEIVHLAINLNGSAKVETVREVERKCGIEEYPSRLEW